MFYHSDQDFSAYLVRLRVRVCFVDKVRGMMLTISFRFARSLAVWRIRWGLPRPGRIKGFVDFAKSDEDGAVAAVFFDPSGSVMAFGAKKVSVSSVFQGELEAMRFGVDLAARLHLGSLCIHSDNLHLVQSVKAMSCPF
uniref:RNase H type-1 domain-containing protein n=1 Tax=Cannabis sativa TaxID=3483 RepID=A0A803P036_CANSA